jgi:hypothetical protein
MKRYVALAVVLALLVGLVGCVAENSTQGLLSETTADQPGPPFATGTPGPGVGPRFTFPGLEGIPRDQLFDHFMSGQFTMTDRNGTPFTVHITPGKVDSISDSSISITPNGQQTSQSFGITTDTLVRGIPRPGSVQAIEPGDKVVVVTRNDSTDAIMISECGAGVHMSMYEWMME